MVTRPDGTSTTYFYDSNYRVTGTGQDTTAPTVQLTGSLYENRSPASLEPGGHALRVQATDGALGATATGVRSVEILVNGQPALSRLDEPCTASSGGSCDLTVDYAFNTASLDEGTYPVLVRVVDNAGNTTTRTFSIIIDDSAPIDYGSIEDGTCRPDSDSGANDCSDNEPLAEVAATPTPPAFGIADNNRLPRYNLFAGP